MHEKRGNPSPKFSACKTKHFSQKALLIKTAFSQRVKGSVPYMQLQPVKKHRKKTTTKNSSFRPQKLSFLMQPRRFPPPNPNAPSPNNNYENCLAGLAFTTFQPINSIPGSDGGKAPPPPSPPSPKPSPSLPPPPWLSFLLSFFTT